MAVRSIYGLGIRFPFSTIISDSGALPGCSQALFSESLWLGSVKLCPGFVRYLVRVCNLLFPLFQTLGCVQVLLSLASFCQALKRSAQFLTSFAQVLHCSHPVFVLQVNLSNNLYLVSAMLYFFKHKPAYSMYGIQSLIQKKIWSACLPQLLKEEKLRSNRGNSGGSWDPSSQKIFELAENIQQNCLD